MGFLDTLLGRTKPVQPNLDALFSLPSAAITLEAATGLVPTGAGSVCFRATEGRAFAEIEKDVRDLLAMGAAAEAPPVELSTDSYGFTWLLVRRPADQLDALVTDVHAVNSSLADSGFGPQLLCSLVGFGGPQAGWRSSTCTSGAPSTRSPRRAARPGTTRSSCRCAGPSGTTSSSSPTCLAGSRCGEHRACERARLRGLLCLRTGSSRLCIPGGAPDPGAAPLGAE